MQGEGAGGSGQMSNDMRSSFKTFSNKTRSNNKSIVDHRRPVPDHRQTSPQSSPNLHPDHLHPIFTQTSCRQVPDHFPVRSNRGPAPSALGPAQLPLAMRREPWAMNHQACIKHQAIRMPMLPQINKISGTSVAEPSDEPV